MGFFDPFEEGQEKKGNDQEEYGYDYYDGFDGEQNPWHMREGAFPYARDESAYGSEGLDTRAPSMSVVELVNWAKAEKVWRLQNPEGLTVKGWKVTYFYSAARYITQPTPVF